MTIVVLQFPKEMSCITWSSAFSMQWNLQNVEAFCSSFCSVTDSDGLAPTSTMRRHHSTSLYGRKRQLTTQNLFNSHETHRIASSNISWVAKRHCSLAEKVCIHSRAEWYIHFATISTLHGPWVIWYDWIPHCCLNKQLRPSFSLGRCNRGIKLSRQIARVCGVCFIQGAIMRVLSPWPTWHILHYITLTWPTINGLCLPY